MPFEIIREDITKMNVDAIVSPPDSVFSGGFRLTENQYRIEHAITVAQKTILKAFELDANGVKHHAKGIAVLLKEAR